jgi:hypothetical protein
MGQQVNQRRSEHQTRLERARALLAQYAQSGADLRSRAERAAEKNPTLRCALPCEVDEKRLDASIAALPVADRYALLAADGSQIAPDRHAPVQFAAVNVGAIRMLPGQGQTPQEVTRSDLHFFTEQFFEGGLWTEDLVALMRDLAERDQLARLAAQETIPVVALTDGPLEMYRDPHESAEFRARRDDYRKVLARLAELQVAAAGYVDKPRSDLVVRLLELVELGDDQLHQAGKAHPLAGVLDQALFRELLAPGERSVVFSIQSGFASLFSGDFALHFFYLNVGRSESGYAEPAHLEAGGGKLRERGHPWIARVEIPRWVAQNAVLINLLHEALLVQCRQLGARPYPYILHRSHEIALVSFDEKEQLETMIIHELRRQGVEVEEESYKQAAKDSGPRRRYT